ncbi:MAG: hypothetical protein ABIQ12_12040, partial [Opitutaceae bacterium]
MKTSLVSLHRLTAAVLGGLSLATAFAQVPPKPPADEAILLNPFDVTAATTKGYMATNTISGTAMNTPLRDVPMAINVITAEFLADTLVGVDLARAFDFNSSI